MGFFLFIYHTFCTRHSQAAAMQIPSVMGGLQMCSTLCAVVVIHFSIRISLISEEELGYDSFFCLQQFLSTNISLFPLNSQPVMSFTPKRPTASIKKSSLGTLLRAWSSYGEQMPNCYVLQFSVLRHISALVKLAAHD